MVELFLCGEYPGMFMGRILRMTLTVLGKGKLEFIENLL